MKILKILEKIPNTQRGNTKYYNGQKLREKFYSLNEYIEEEDVLLVPFYITTNETYELYEFELQICEVQEKNFNKYVLELTGKININEVQQVIIDREKNTYIEFLKNSNENLILPMRGYLKYIFSSSRVKKEIIDVFGTYNEDNVFFAVY